MNEIANWAEDLWDPGSSVAVVCPDSAGDAGYFAAGLARTLAEKGRPQEHIEAAGGVVLIDGLPGTGGLDVLADLDAAPGARWGALEGAAGSIDIERLHRALPTRDGVAVLAHDRARDPVDDQVRSRAISSLAEISRWVVGTQPPDRVPDPGFTAVVLLVRSGVLGLTAAQRYVEQMATELPVAVVCLETPSATRSLVADSVGRALVAAPPTRWKLASAASSEVANGYWPGSKDRTLRKVLDEVGVYLSSQGRSAAWA